jgi:hypothetical protein
MLGPVRGPRGSRAFHLTRRPWKRRRLWARSLEEPSGVRGAECGESHQGNKGDLTRSRVHTPRKAWHKQVTAKSRLVRREKSERDIVLGMMRTTEPHRREGPLLQRCPAGSDVMVHARQSQPHPHEKSRDLQRRLYLAAKRNRSRRFHALYDRIVRPDVLWRAWEEVRANRGRSGVDGVRIEDVERDGVEPYLAALAGDLKAQVYRPQPWAGGPTSRLGTPRRSWPISIGTYGFGCGGS